MPPPRPPVHSLRATNHHSVAHAISVLHNLSCSDSLLGYCFKGAAAHCSLLLLGFLIVKEHDPRVVVHGLIISTALAELGIDEGL